MELQGRWKSGLIGCDANETSQEESGAILLQLVDVVPQTVGVGIQQSVTPLGTPAVSCPIPTPIHDHKPRVGGVDDPHFDLGQSLRHGFSGETQPPHDQRGRDVRYRGFVPPNS
jgi:hypothetical protein